MAFETPQMVGKPTPSLDKLGQCCHPQVEKYFLLFWGNLLCFTLCSFPLSWHHWKEPNSFFLEPIPQVFTDIDEIPLSWVFSRLRSPSSPSLSSKEGCSCPLNFVALCWSLQYVYSLLYWGVQNWIQHSCCGLTDADHFGTDPSAETFDRQLLWDCLSSYHKGHLLLFED